VDDGVFFFVGCVFVDVCSMWFRVAPKGTIDKHHWLKGGTEPPLIARWQLGVAWAQLRS